MLLTTQTDGSSRYYALTGTLVMAFVGGYTVFLPGNWDIPTFFFSYTMIGVTVLSFLYWKVVHRTTVSIFCVLHVLNLVDLPELHSGENCKT
jgi:amino acid permease